MAVIIVIISSFLYTYYHPQFEAQISSLQIMCSVYTNKILQYGRKIIDLEALILSLLNGSDDSTYLKAEISHC